MHDGAVGGDGTTHDGAIVVQVDDDDLIGFIDFLADTKGTQVRQIGDGPCLGGSGTYQM